VHETIDGEAVIINLESASYFTLEGAGAAAWDGLVAGASAGELARLVAARYLAEDGVIADAIANLIQALGREGLIRPLDPAEGAGAGPAAEAVAGERPPFAPIELRRFTDLQELLLLDPVHEVDAAGWPMQAAES